MGTQLAHIPNAWSDERRGKVHISRIYADGFLYLAGNAEAWIQHNLAGCLLVCSLELNLQGCNDAEKIGYSIAELTELTHLSICDSVSLKCVTNILSLQNLQVLKFRYCTILEELPQNLGDLRNLTHLELVHCGAIKSLPNSIADISNLSTLILTFCQSLSALPENMNVVDLNLRGCCSIQCLPRSLSNLQHLHLHLCSLIEQRFSNFKHAMMLPQLTFSVCRAHTSQCYIIKNLPSFVGQHNLQRLCFVDVFVDELPTNLDELPQLLFIDIHQCSNIKYLPCNKGHSEATPLFYKGEVVYIRPPQTLLKQEPLGIGVTLLLLLYQCSNIKYLPCNLKNLLNLQFLHLPSNFRLETLLNTLNNSVIICVEKRHIRKTWKEIQLDLGLHDRASAPMVEMMEAAQNRFPLHALSYLSLKDHPSSWILNHYDLRCLVQIMDLERPDSIEEIGDIVGALPNLTHLYIGAISNNTHLYTLAKDCFQCLPDTPTRLIHLSLHFCDLHYLSSDSLRKLSNLKSLDLCLRATELPASLNLLYCLERLTLRNRNSYLLPDCVAKLSNLNTLEFYECSVTLPENLNITALKLVCSHVHPLPSSLCHLELVHDINYCKSVCGDHFETCLEQVTNLKTLSLTCYRVKFLPCIAELQDLQKLLLKDCFRLETLLSILDESVNLCTLDVSGTRIKSLPECITKLPKVQHLVLPKCYEQKNLPSQFLGNESNVRIEFDEIDERYYKDVGYYDSTFESSQETLDKHNETSYDNNDITPCTVVGEEGIINAQTSSCRLANPPEATQALGDFHLSGRNFSTGESRHNGSHCTQNQERRIIYSEVHPMAIADMITELRFGIQATDNFGKDRDGNHELRK